MAKLIKTNLEVYVIHYNGTPLHMVKERIYEWTPSKKVYFSLRAAKLGINYVPSMIRDQCEIVKYTPEL